eukprot:s1677_g1.t1
MSSLGPLDDGPPSLANQRVQPPVQPAEPRLPQATLLQRPLDDGPPSLANQPVQPPVQPARQVKELTFHASPAQAAFCRGRAPKALRVDACETIRVI